jgi:hypothetical protein
MSTTTSRTSEELVQRYLQAVRFWLPKTQRQQDLLAEYGEDLRSQIEAREEELGRPLDQAEVSTILKNCGNPMEVAGRLGPERSLIGPGLFPIYAFVLKMVLLWILVPVFIFIVGPVNLANVEGDWGRAIVNTLGALWSGSFIAAGVVTLVFAILERTQALAGMTCKWDPSRLPPLQKPERKTSFLQTFCELVFNVFGLVWLLLVPHHLWMILGPAATFLEPAPLWHTVYVPIVLLAIANILRPAVILGRPQWTWFPLTTQLVQSTFMLLLLNFMLNAVSQPASGAWYPFLTLADSVKNSPHFIRIAAVVNVSVLISLACTWIGVCIGGVVQTWRLLRLIRKQISIGRQAASQPVR